MPTVDFTDWAVPDLVLTLSGGSYVVPPPSVDRARLLLACAARAEITLGLAPGPLPDELTVLLDGLGDTPLGEITLGREVLDTLMADGYPPATLDRVAYYALHYWARGRERADLLAAMLWTIQDGGEAPPPFGRPHLSSSTSGRSTESGSQTPTGSIPTTASRPTSSRRARSPKLPGSSGGSTSSRTGT